MRKIDFEPKNIIVRMPNWIGDIVMATPVLTDIKTKYPNSALTVMCKAPICEILQYDEDIDELYCFTKQATKLFERRKETKNIISRLKQGGYDLGVLLTNSFSSAWWFWQGGVKNIIGYDCNLRNMLLSYPVKRSENHEKEHQVVFYKKLLAPLGIEVSDTFPRLHMSDKELNNAKTLLYQRGYKEGSPLIGINPTASFGPAKCWPKERFREIIQKLIEEKNCYVVCFGDISSVDLVKEVCWGLSDKVINLAGVTSICELVSVIQLCDVLLTNDSGPMHIAAAVKTPLIALFGSTNRHKTGPYKHGKVIQKNVACSPCYLKVCPIDFRCMKRIAVEEVLQAITDALEKKNV
ncbi:MAG: lipopolysaccharide heptosyltransferase II [Chlamydiota bacterium]